jgi:hypothetical protein
MKEEFFYSNLEQERLDNRELRREKVREFFEKIKGLPKREVLLAMALFGIHVAALQEERFASQNANVTESINFASELVSVENGNEKPSDEIELTFNEGEYEMESGLGQVEVIRTAEMIREMTEEMRNDREGVLAAFKKLRDFFEAGAPSGAAEIYQQVFGAEYWKGKRIFEANYVGENLLQSKGANIIVRVLSTSNSLQDISVTKENMPDDWQENQMTVEIFKAETVSTENIEGSEVIPLHVKGIGNTQDEALASAIHNAAWKIAAEQKPDSEKIPEGAGSLSLLQTVHIYEARLKSYRVMKSEVVESAASPSGQALVSVEIEVVPDVLKKNLPVETPKLTDNSI